jgi:hypothetical protein
MNWPVRADSLQADAILLTASVSCPRIAGFVLPEMGISIYASTKLRLYLTFLCWYSNRNKEIQNMDRIC